MKTQNAKHSPTTPRSLFPALVFYAMFAIISSAGVASAQDLSVNTFDSGIGGIDWENFRTYVYGETYVWDPSQDANGNPNSGSLYLTLEWPLKSDPNWNNSWNDVQIAFYTPTFESTNYISFDVDIKVDVANSYPAMDGGPNQGHGPVVAIGEG